MYYCCGVRVCYIEVGTEHVSYIVGGKNKRCVLVVAPVYLEQIVSSNSSNRKTAVRELCR